MYFIGSKHRKINAFSPNCHGINTLLFVDLLNVLNAEMVQLLELTEVRVSGELKEPLLRQQLEPEQLQMRMAETSNHFQGRI